MMHRPWLSVAILSVATLGLTTTACSKKPTEAATPTSSRDFNEGRTGSEGAGPQRHPDLRTVYFEYDSADIRADQKGTLKNNADAIARHAEWRTITVEGHTDERGTEEYNLALGDRRAASAKKYLENLGVSGAKLVTVSLGESQPAVAGHDESAFAKNRRAEFLYSK